MAEEEEDKPLRVVDRRMFTAEGNLRPDYKPEEPPPETPKPRSAPAPPPPAARSAEPPAEAGHPERGRRSEEEKPEGPESEPAGDFALMVRSLATTAYAALGLLPDPASGARHRDPAVARQMIDWLTVLEQKTRGNLTFEESDFLSRVLYELRLAFVEMTRSPAPKP
jgi:Domain of unknown function (DUF1844)